MPNSKEIILNDIINSKKIHFVSDDIELKMNFKIYDGDKGQMKEGNKEGRKLSLEERIRFFSGEEKTKKQVARNYKPRKLVIPAMFQQSDKSSSKNANSDLNNNNYENKKVIKNKTTYKKIEKKEKINDLNKGKYENWGNKKDGLKNLNLIKPTKTIDVNTYNNENKIIEYEKRQLNYTKKNENLNSNNINKDKEVIKGKKEINNLNDNNINDVKKVDVIKIEEEKNINKNIKNYIKENNEKKKVEEYDLIKRNEKEEIENNNLIENQIIVLFKEKEVDDINKKKDETKKEDVYNIQKYKNEEIQFESENKLKNNLGTNEEVAQINKEENYEQKNESINDNKLRNKKEIEKNEINYVNIVDQPFHMSKINEQINKIINNNNEEIKALEIDIKKNKENIYIYDEDYLYEERECPDENEQQKENENEKDKVKNKKSKKKKNDKKVKFFVSDTFQKEAQKTDEIPSFKSNTGDVFLESMNYSKYLKSLQKKGLKESKRETFCEGFFITSFPFKNPSVIEKSQSFPSCCGHEDCSKLPSMKPEIIIRYPLKDTKNLELNNLAATICFPTGIKVCYSETNPSNLKDYITPITNEKGERYYMMTHHFYKKISREDYDKKYEMHPLKHHLMKFGDAYLSLSEEELNEKIGEIQESLDLCQNLGFRDYLYIPYCLCLISKYPYINELKTCLKCIYRILSKEKLISGSNKEEDNIEINNLIMHIIHSVPIPDPNSIVKFFIPYYNRRLEINCPKIDDISIMNANTCTLLTVFSVDHIVTIYKLLILEKKILFIDKYYERLAKVTDGFISLLYPMQWIHTYIPIMSDQMLKYLETFLPFLNGIHDSLMPLVTDIFNENDMDNDELFLVYINDDKIKLGSSLTGKKTKTDKYIQEKIPPLPSELEKKLKNKLKKIKHELSSVKKDNNNDNIELKIRNAFIDFFIGMFHDYEKYLFLLDDQDVIFNNSLFLETVPINEKPFYEEIIDTQLFQQFTQNIIKEDYNYFYNRKELREIENSDKKEKIQNNTENKETKEIKEKSPEIFQKYVVSPFYLNIKETEVKNIESNLRKKYPTPIKDMDDSERILTELAEIDNNKYINENCLIFLTPEQKKEEEESASNKNLYLRKSTMPKLTVNMDDIKVRMTIKIATKHTIIDPEKYNEKRKEDIKEYIHDFMAKIFKSEINNITNTEKSDLMNVIETTYGRECFINLLSYNTGNLVLLQHNSFIFLGNLIYNTLIGTLKIEETDKVLEDIVLLMKSTKHFGMEEKGKTTNVFDIYKKKLQNTPKIMQYNYWKKRFDIDLKNKENNDDKVKQQIIYNIVSDMIEFEIGKTTVKTITEKISNEVFGKDSELSKETFKVFIKQITEAHYISKIRI